MDYSNLYSILNLYLRKEKDKHAINVNFTKNQDNILLYFNINNTGSDRTTLSLPLQVINDYLSDILKKIKNEQIIIDEKCELDKNNNYVYYIKFANGRIISFNNFSIMEINNIRNILYNIDIRQEEIRIVQNANNSNKIQMNYKPILQPTGYIHSNSIFLMAIIFADVFMISLWIFKVLIIG